MAANKDEKVPDIVTNAVLVQSEQMPENSEICRGKNELNLTNDHLLAKVL